MWIEVITPAPVINIPDFRFAFGGMGGSEIPRNQNGFPKYFEFVALTGQRFFASEQIDNQGVVIYRIRYPGYSHSNLYIDSRFTRNSTAQKPKSIPAKELILNRMKTKIGTPYVWGGNWSPGIAKMLEYYPPQAPLDDETKRLWTMQGLDCSGLLYEASEGTTPRNTSELLFFGNPLSKSKPLSLLDAIVYPGHIVFVVDSETTIESKYPFGVIYRNLTERISEIEQKRHYTEKTEDAENYPESIYTIRRF